MKRTTMGIAALLLIGILATGAFAFMGDNEMRNAFESGDYNAYKQAYQNGLLSEEEFNAQLQEREERQAQGEQKQADMGQRHEQMEAAIAQGYDAWKELAGNSPMADQITEENWDTFVELHNAQERVRELSEELGLGKGPGMPGMKGLMRGR